ncbi:MAG: hypothetical protein ACRDXX_04095 [Stackebrandtia sp.]
MTGMVDRLVLRGLLLRQSDAGDRRIVKPAPTKEGVALASRARAEFAAAGQRCADLSVAEKERMAGLAADR